MVIDRTGQHCDVTVGFNGSTENFQQLKRGRHILKTGNIGEMDLFITQQTGEQDW